MIVVTTELHKGGQVVWRIEGADGRLAERIARYAARGWSHPETGATSIAFRIVTEGRAGPVVGLENRDAEALPEGAQRRPAFYTDFAFDLMQSRLFPRFVWEEGRGLLLVAVVSAKGAKEGALSPTHVQVLAEPYGIPLKARGA